MINYDEPNSNMLKLSIKIFDNEFEIKPKINNIIY